jgi:hypothetical protein
MKNGLVTEDGTRILTVNEYDKFIRCIPKSMRAIFEVNMLTGLKYVELQQLYDNPQWYFKKSDKIIFPKETQRNGKQKVLCMPHAFSNLFSIFLNNKKPPYRSSWNKDLARWSVEANINPKVGLKTPKKTIEIWLFKIGLEGYEIRSMLGYYPVTHKQCQKVSFTDNEIEMIEQRLCVWRIIEREYSWDYDYRNKAYCIRKIVR